MYPTWLFFATQSEFEILFFNDWAVCDAMSDCILAARGDSISVYELSDCILASRKDIFSLLDWILSSKKDCPIAP